jgi:DivIVA protein
MSYFHRPDAGLESTAPTEDPPRSPRSPFSEVAGRFANWITGADQIPRERPENAYEPDEDPVLELTMGGASERPSSFPVAPFGYDRDAVDEHMLSLERQLAELRAQRQPAVSITEELERIGEQTASILVVAHDQAHETTRQAREQAERCVADAAANAVAITSAAKQRLRELDSETDAVWRERERLLEDVRVVSVALAALADRASDRFPAADPGSAPQATAPFSPAWEAEATAAFGLASEPSEPSEPPAPREPPEPESSAAVAGPWAGEAFRMSSWPRPAHEYPPAGVSADDESPAPGAQSGDTGSWLAGLEPPDQS